MCGEGAAAARTHARAHRISPCPFRSLEASSSLPHSAAYACRRETESGVESVPRHRKRVGSRSGLAHRSYRGLTALRSSSLSSHGPTSRFWMSTGSEKNVSAPGGHRARRRVKKGMEVGSHRASATSGLRGFSAGALCGGALYIPMRQMRSGLSLTIRSGFRTRGASSCGEEHGEGKNRGQSWGKRDVRPSRAERMQHAQQ